MKTKRYVLPALPARTVVLIPMVGNTLLSSVMSALRTEGVPRSAKLRILRRADGSRSLRAEFVE